jgi:AcrR family transcriptional regulator
MVVVEDDARPRRRLGPNDWVDAALETIAAGGIAAVGVESLARRLGVTKGSFYWHFANREALLQAALARWEKSHTEDVIAELEGLGLDPLLRLRLLIRRVVETAERDPIGVALLATATHPVVAPVLARVAERRIAYNASVFGELGFAPDEARRRGLLAYSAYLGHAELAHSTPQVLPHSRTEARAYLEHVLNVLTGTTRG